MNKTTDLGTTPIRRLFRTYLVPTLVGMLSLCAVTAADGIFIGQGVGSDGLAAVNIAYAPAMVMTGIALMLGMGSSVIASITLAKGDAPTARQHATHALAFATIVTGLFVIACLAHPAKAAELLGSSPSLTPLVCDYIIWLFPGLVLQAWAAIGLFIIRLDGAPRYAMWCNIIPGALNVLLDYLFVFPLGMGIKGAAIATCISIAAGGIMAIAYLARFATTMRLTSIDMRLMLRHVWQQSRIGVSALLGEAMMGVLMFTGNYAFMRHLGDNGVGAFSIACYYCPFVFMIGNAIAQSAQPIISYNLGLNNMARVKQATRLSIVAAVCCGAASTLLFTTLPDVFVWLFVGSASEATPIASHGLPLFAAGFTFFVFNVASIGYMQSVERVAPSIVFALLRGAVLLVPSFIVLPQMLGTNGLWLALTCSEGATAACIAIYWATTRHRR